MTSLLTVSQKTDIFDVVDSGIEKLEKDIARVEKYPGSQLSGSIGAKIKTIRSDQINRLKVIKDQLKENTFSGLCQKCSQPIKFDTLLVTPDAIFCNQHLFENYQSMLN